MGKKRRIGQLEAAAAPPQPAEPKPEAISISADDAGEAKPAEVPVAKGEVKSEEAKTEGVTHKRKKQKREEEMEMEVQRKTLIEQCGDGDVEKIEPPTKKRRKKKKKKKKKNKSSEVSELQDAEVVADDAVAREKKNKNRKKLKRLYVCVICREKGHVISTCPLLSQTKDSNKKSGNKLPDCPQPLQDVDLKNGKAEKLLGCPLVETLCKKKNYGAKEDESIVKNGEESSCTPVDVFLKDQKSDGREDNAIVSVDSGSHPEKELCETND